MESAYSYDDVRKEADDIDAKVRRYKSLLAVSNATTIVPEFNMTIGECLVYLSLLNAKKTLLSCYVARKPVTRISSAYNTKVEYTELLYDVNQVKKDAEEAKTEETPEQTK